MSYILDALKKSEGQRENISAPSVQTVHTSSLLYHGEKKKYWPYVLIFIVLLNLIAIIYFIVDKNKVGTTLGNNGATTTQPKPTKNINLAPEGVEQSNTFTPEYPVPFKNTAAMSAVKQRLILEESAQKKNIKNASKTHLTNKQKRTQKPPVKINATKNKVIDYNDLPTKTASKLPSLVISAHVYSSNPKQRSIVINNKFLEEGERIIEDIYLVEITADGAIIRSDGLLIHYSDVATWGAP